MKIARCSGVWVGMLSAAGLVAACGSTVEPAGGGSGGSGGDGGGDTTTAGGDEATSAVSSGSGAGGGSAGCPEDLSGSVGQPCAEEGKFCGGESCSECEFCNVIQCSGGKWENLEAFPDPDCGKTSCGGFAGDTCAPDEFCEFENLGKETCGLDNGLGVCSKRPTDGCDKSCPGVCGCDGEFHCNECMANAAGFDITGESESCQP